MRSRQFRRPHGVCRDEVVEQGDPRPGRESPTTTRATPPGQPTRGVTAVTTPAQHQADGVDLQLDPLEPVHQLGPGILGGCGAPGHVGR